MTATQRCAGEASGRLNRRLIDLARLGIRPHCSEPITPGYWTSEHEPERRLAVAWCRGCPVLVECGEAAVAHDERWGVWAGVDRSVRPGKKLQRNSKAG
jgi:Transcription factor WhiB